MSLIEALFARTVVKVTDTVKITEFAFSVLLIPFKTPPVLAVLGTTMLGALSVMTHGLLMMPMWPADNLDFLTPVPVNINWLLFHQRLPLYLTLLMPSYVLEAHSFSLSNCCHETNFAACTCMLSFKIDR